MSLPLFLICKVKIQMFLVQVPHPLKRQTKSLLVRGVPLISNEYVTFIVRINLVKPQIFPGGKGYSLPLGNTRVIVIILYSYNSIAEGLRRPQRLWFFACSYSCPSHIIPAKPMYVRVFHSTVATTCRSCSLT